MNGKEIIAISVMAMLLISGCTTAASSWEIQDSGNPKETYEFNFAKTTKIGYLLIHAIPPERQLVISQYGIKIDDKDIVPVMKYSDTLFILDEGEHRLEICALPHMWKGVYGQTVGKPTIIQISIRQGEKTVFEYIGPRWAFGEGKLKEKVF